MKKLNQIILTVAAVSTLVACNKTDFASVDVTATKLVDIPLDPVTPQPLPLLGYKLSDGLCASDSSTQVLSCVKCNVPQVVAKPQLSAKAQALLDITTLVCNMPSNKNLTNIRPTKEMILNKLNQASEINYPESVRTDTMSLIIKGLTNPNDNSVREKMFGGLFYRPPFSDEFETYFGITIAQTISTFCWNGDKMNGVVTNPDGAVGLISKDYLDCQYTDQWYNCKEKPVYITAQGFRSQLDKALALGVTNPYSAPKPDPAKKCSWNKFEGDDLVAAHKQLKAWKAEGRKVSLAVKKNDGAAFCGDADESNIIAGSSVEMATYKCE
ncbi:MAG: hypothetical protein WA160_06270 [Pseudobdellovibrio sp.]